MFAETGDELGQQLWLRADPALLERQHLPSLYVIQLLPRGAAVSHSTQHLALHGIY